MDDTIFMPHSTCLAGNQLLIKLMNGGDAIIALSYIFSSLAILYLCWQQWKVFRGVSRWFIFSYGLFIISCAATHVMDVVVYYHPHYWVQMWIVLWTGLIAVPVTIFTIKVVPWFLGLASAPEEIASVVNQLQLVAAELQEIKARVDKGQAHPDQLEAAKESVERESKAVNEVIEKAIGHPVC
jgi:hypothetical protein